MADRYLSFTGTAPGRLLARRLGLPQPAELSRRSPERPAPDGPLPHLTAGKSALALASGAVDGQVVRVCGQSLPGA